jgi:hypothetical protein
MRQVIPLLRRFDRLVLLFPITARRQAHDYSSMKTATTWLLLDGGRQSWDAWRYYCSKTSRVFSLAMLKIHRTYKQIEPFARTATNRSAQLLFARSAVWDSWYREGLIAIVMRTAAHARFVGAPYPRSFTVGIAM